MFMLKRVLKYLIFGIAWGWCFFVIINMIGVITVGNDFLKPIVDHFIQQALGSALVGICCGTSAIVYTFEKMPFWQQISIHSLIGLTGYFTVAYKFGWMPVSSGLLIASYILFGILIFAGIWFCFYLYSKHEVRKVNDRLGELEKEKDDCIVQ